MGSTALAWPLAADPQDRMRRVGVLMNTTAEDPEARSPLAAFQQAMQQLGWTKGRNLRSTYGGLEACRGIRRYAAELVALSPDLMLAAAVPRICGSAGEPHRSDHIHAGDRSGRLPAPSPACRGRAAISPASRNSNTA